MELCYFCVGSCLEKVTRLCYHVDRNRCLERGAMMTREKWYQNDYRRYLCDMHIADWDESFLSQFSAEEYFQNLKKNIFGTKMSNSSNYLYRKKFPRFPFIFEFLAKIRVKNVYLFSSSFLFKNP